LNRNEKRERERGNKADFLLRAIFLAKSIQ